jgi:endoglucanase
MKMNVLLVLPLLFVASCNEHRWQALWNSYTAAFMDDQIRVIDRDAGDRTTSEAQAYAMFFALVTNDRSRFERLLRWTALNLSAGDVADRLPAWLWGRNPNGQWGILDANAASDADVWMAYTLLEAGEAWHEPQYTSLGTSLANRIASEEVIQIAGVGPVLLPGPKGFQHGDSCRLNASYLPLQLFLRLGQLLPNGPWQQMATMVPVLVKHSAPHGFAMDWTEYHPDTGFTPSPIGSYDAIRVYLWAGMLDPATPGRDALLGALHGMAQYLRANTTPPAKVKRDGSIEDTRGPVGFSAALLQYLGAIGETRLAGQQDARVRSSLDRKNGLYGIPARYYDQNLILFALGSIERQFWFGTSGQLKTGWKH